MRLLLLSDTHVPARARDLPAPVWRAVDEADVVVHAGDWVSGQLLDRLAGRAARLVGVFGNNDDAVVRERLPELARVDVGHLRVAVLHDSGPAKGRTARLARAFPDADLVVFGHSHIPWDSSAPGGPRLLNPGSPTDRRRQPVATYMTAEVAGGVLHRVCLHEAGGRIVTVEWT